MLRRLEFLVPSLLKRIDRQLLLHRPGLWATRIHYVAFYGSILALLMGLYTLVRPMSLQNVPSPDSFAIALSIPLVLGFAVWVYYLTFFRLEKHKGFNWALNSFRDELLHLGVIATLATIPLLFGNQLSNRIDQQITHEALLTDINTLKMGGQFFEKGVYSTGNDYHSVLEGLHYDHFGLSGELFSYEIEQKMPRSSCRKRQLIEDFRFIYHKYTGYTIPLSAREILNSDGYLHIPTLGNSDEVLRRNLVQLVNAKENRFVINDGDFLKTFFFFCFLLWLGLQTFLKTNWKQFLSALLLAVALAFGLGLSSSLLEAGFDIPTRIPVNLMMLTSILVFLYQGYRQHNTKRANQWKSVSLILGTLMIPLIPTNIAALFDSIDMDIVYHLLYAGIAVAFISWNLTLRSRFVDLMATPTDN